MLVFLVFYTCWPLSPVTTMGYGDRYTVMACIGMGYMVMAYIDMTYIVMVYIVMVWVPQLMPSLVSALPDVMNSFMVLLIVTYGLYSHSLYSHGLYRYGLYRYGL